MTAIAGAVVLTGLFRVLAPDLAWLPFGLLLGGAAVMVTMKSTGDPALARLVGASFAVRAVLGSALYFVSSLGLPLLSSLHLAHGLWTFGIDGVSSHEYAVRALEDWRAGRPLPVYVPEMLPFGVPLAILYALVGPQAIHFILANSWIGAVCGLLGYRLATLIGADRRAALAAAAILGFWPSSLIWSTQVLKDSASLALILALFVLAAGLWQRGTDRPRTDAGVWRWPMLATAMIVLGLFRIHVAAALAVALALAFGAAAAHDAVRRRWSGAARGAALVAVSFGAMMASTELDLVALSSPGAPEAAYVRLGADYERRGEFIQATGAYERAIEFDRRAVAAHRGFVRSLMAHGQYAPAQEALPAYLEVETDPIEREKLRRLVPPRPPAESFIPPAYAIAPPPPPSRAAAPAPPPAGPVIAPAPAWVPPPPPPVFRPTIAQRVRARVPLLSIDRIAEFRRSQIEFSGGNLVDTTTFDGWPAFLRFLPRALAIAFLAPYPWDLLSPGASTGAFRPVAVLEVLLIAALLPAVVAGSWRVVRLRRPVGWSVMLFVLGAAVSYAIFMPNGGTLFRVRLQYLFPALILAVTALPSFVSQGIAALTRRVDLVAPPVRA